MREVGTPVIGGNFLSSIVKETLNKEIAKDNILGIKSYEYNP